MKDLRRVGDRRREDASGGRIMDLGGRCGVFYSDSNPEEMRIGLRDGVKGAKMRVGERGGVGYILMKRRS